MRFVRYKSGFGQVCLVFHFTSQFQTKMCRWMKLAGELLLAAQNETACALLFLILVIFFFHFTY